MPYGLTPVYLLRSTKSVFVQVMVRHVQFFKLVARKKSLVVDITLTMLLSNRCCEETLFLSVFPDVEDVHIIIDRAIFQLIDLHALIIVTHEKHVTVRDLWTAPRALRHYTLYLGFFGNFKFIREIFWSM